MCCSQGWGNLHALRETLGWSQRCLFLLPVSLHPPHTSLDSPHSWTKLEAAPLAIIQAAAPLLLFRMDFSLALGQTSARSSGPSQLPPMARNAHSIASPPTASLCVGLLFSERRSTAPHVKSPLRPRPILVTSQHKHSGAHSLFTQQVF